MDIDAWAEAKTQEYITMIKGFISEGISPIEAYRIAMEGSVLGIKYKQRIRKEVGLD
jgi:hypothetical protein